MRRETGIVTQGVGEASASAAALEYTQARILEQRPDLARLTNYFDGLALIFNTEASVGSLAPDEESFEIAFPDPLEAEFIVGAWRYGAAQHPDQLVRATLESMVTEYDNAVPAALDGSLAPPLNASTDSAYLYQYYVSGRLAS